MARINAAAYNVMDYKNRLMDEHNNVLKQQLDNQARVKRELEQAQRQQEQQLAQRHASVNSLLNAKE